jgi:ribosomal protein S18 acetylase RimI-like enzyme
VIAGIEDRHDGVFNKVLMHFDKKKASLEAAPTIKSGRVNKTMQLKLKNNREVTFRKFKEEDFPAIHSLNEKEEWNNLVSKRELTREAWLDSGIAYVAESEGEIIGYIRGLTDQHITLFICELLIDQNFRGCGIGARLLDYVHTLYPSTRVEMLASSTSKTFYEQQSYRPFYGFRKTFEERH